MVKEAYAPKEEKIMPKYLKQNEACITVVGAMSAERNLVHKLMRSKFIKGVDFLDFFRELRAKTG